jgi:hypothetical protein
MFKESFRSWGVFNRDAMRNDIQNVDVFHIMTLKLNYFSLTLWDFRILSAIFGLVLQSPAREDNSASTYSSTCAIDRIPVGL